MPAVLETAEFNRWYKRLRDPMGKAKILLRIDRLRDDDNPGDVKPVGAGVTEMRVDSGPGYRVYYTQTGKGYILLVAGDKSSQRKDIARAVALARELKEHG